MNDVTDYQDVIHVEETQTVFVLGEFNELVKTYDIKKDRLVDNEFWYTTVEPPAYTEQTIPVFNKETQEWSVVSDYRGFVEYSAKGTEAYYIDYLGDVRKGFTLDSPSTIDAKYNVRYR